MKPEIVYETNVRKLGECGGHFWAPAYEEPKELDGCPPEELDGCSPEELDGCPRRPRT
jgi:hypothetical protein